MAFNIFAFELRDNEEFKKWFEKYAIIIRIVTLLASGNVELLHVLDSKYGGFPLFDAPFSQKAIDWIFWSGFANLFIEDIPQLLIQVNFKFFF